MSELIKMNESELKRFHEEIGSPFFDLHSKISSGFGEKQIELYYKILDLHYGTVTVIGVVAGLGFSAFGAVANKPMFLVAELFLLSDIGAALIWLDKVYSTEFKNINDAISGVADKFNTRSAKYTAIYQALLKNGEVEKSLLLDLNTFDNKLPDWMADMSPQRTSKNQNYRPPMFRTLFIFGSLLLLLSFIDIGNVLFSLFS